MENAVLADTSKEGGMPRQTSPQSQAEMEKVSIPPTEDSESTEGEMQRIFARKPSQANTVMPDAQKMKDKIRQDAMKPIYDVCNFYHKTGLWQEIARHQKFEYITLAVISFNALWISIDTDLNKASDLMSAHAVFQIAEQCFCFYFSFEWFVRFKSFEKKRNGLKDAWFVFDSTLVLFMVLETWVMSLSLIVLGGDAASGGGLENASILRMARLLRLSRMARMARLLKAMPELLILIKAMAASLRSCFFVFVLLALIMYVFGILFTQLTVETPVGEKYFSTVLGSMHTLWIDGTLLDSTGLCVRMLWDESVLLVMLFYVFVLLSALTVMNMLIGVLCEVVSAVAQTEKESLTVNWVKMKLQEILLDSGLDQNGDAKISKTELSSLLAYPEACKALKEVGVDVFNLIDNIDFLFEADADDETGDDDEEKQEKVLTFEEFMALILDLRGTNMATVKDVVDLQKYIKKSNEELLYKIERALMPRQCNHRRTSITKGENSPSAGGRRRESRSSTLPAQVLITGADDFAICHSASSGMSRQPSSNAKRIRSDPGLLARQGLPVPAPQKDGNLGVIVDFKVECQELMEQKLLPMLAEISVLHDEFTKKLRETATPLRPDADRIPRNGDPVALTVPVPHGHHDRHHSELSASPSPSLKGHPHHPHISRASTCSSRDLDNVDDACRGTSNLADIPGQVQPPDFVY